MIACLRFAFARDSPNAMWLQDSQRAAGFIPAVGRAAPPELTRRLTLLLVFLGALNVNRGPSTSGISSRFTFFRQQISILPVLMGGRLMALVGRTEYDGFRLGLPGQVQIQEIFS
jgi:hypothetical protein